jgi:hypothetical protein
MRRLGRAIACDGPPKGQQSPVLAWDEATKACKERGLPSKESAMAREARVFVRKGSPMGCKGLS